MLKRLHVPHLGHEVTFVPRDVLRRKTGHARKFSAGTHLKGLAGAIPTPPATFDWSQGGKITLPIYGNDQVGNCYYTAALHEVQLWTGNNGSEATFDAAKVVARYLKLSRGDNGLGDDQILPEFKAGVVGPHGPYAILDDLTINPADDAAIKLACWAFGGVFYTAALLDSWLNNMNPGALWDARGTPDPNAGHAMVFSGWDGSAYLDQTWGLRPCIRVTPAGVKHSDPEIVVCFSRLWFSPTTGLAPTGMHYTEAAALWTRFGGQSLPPWNGPTPAPAPAPTPSPSNALGCVITLGDGSKFKATGWAPAN